MQGEAELRILDFKTTWSEIQKPCQTTAMRGEAELRLYNLKRTLPPQSRSQAVVCVSTPRMYPRSGYFLVNPYNELSNEVLNEVLSQVASELSQVKVKSCKKVPFY